MAEYSLHQLANCLHRHRQLQARSLVRSGSAGYATRSIAIQISNCKIAHDLVVADVGTSKVEADVMTFDPTYVSGIGFQHRACFVETGYSDLREDFPDMNQMTREGSGWRNFREAGDLSAMEFSI